MSRPVRRALAAVPLLLAGTLAAAMLLLYAVPGPPACLGQHPDREQPPASTGSCSTSVLAAVPTVGYRLTDELTADPSGEIVWLTGEYFINVAVSHATYHDGNGNPTYPGPQKFRTRNLANVMAVALTGDFEAQVTARARGAVADRGERLHAHLAHPRRHRRRPRRRAGESPALVGVLLPRVHRERQVVARRRKRTRGEAVNAHGRFTARLKSSVTVPSRRRRGHRQRPVRRVGRHAAGLIGEQDAQAAVLAVERGQRVLLRRRTKVDEPGAV